MKIIGFEGWLQGKDAHVAKLLRSIGAKDFKTYASHQVVKHPGVPTIWLGISLGGHQALKHAKAGDICITLDPRWQSGASYFDVLIPFQKPFTAPAGVKAYNFFRHGLMPGYPVNGAENKKLPWYVSHPGVASNAEVRAKVKSLLGGK